MKNLVEDKVFKDELELWFFLQSLKGQKLGLQDGVWQLLGLRDELSPAEGPHRQFTERDFARACDALVKALGTEQNRSCLFFC